MLGEQLIHARGDAGNIVKLVLLHQAHQHSRRLELLRRPHKQRPLHERTSLMAMISIARLLSGRP
jgi:hypothetical protein